MARILANLDIEVVKGETAVFNLSLSINGEAYVKADGDRIIMEVKKDLREGGTALIHKSLDADLKLHLDPEDTNNLLAGDYVWGLKITLMTGQAIPCVVAQEFKLVKGVVS